MAVQFFFCSELLSKSSNLVIAYVIHSNIEIIFRFILSFIIGVIPLQELQSNFTVPELSCVSVA